MKNLAIILFLTFSTVASATSWYISPSGNDNNNGSISAPFFTLNKAWSSARAGDIIYVRGGLYKYDSRQNLTGKSGTASDTIRIWSYPGERPVFTKSSSFTTPSWPVCLIYVKANYIHIKGIEVAYFTQKTSTIWYGIAVQGSNNNKFEMINSHHNGHGMVIRDESNHNLVLNCDFHDNFDPLTQGDAYGNADGLEVGYQSSSMENKIVGCRLWHNSDDGIDLWQNNGNVIIERCWSWYNGYREDGRTAGGDGGGFKFGSTTTQSGTEFKRTIRNSIAVYNRTRGFNQNGAKVKFYCYNNISWKNPYGFVFYTDNLAHVFRNNIVFDNSTENWNGTFTNSVKDHNSYDAGLPSSGPVASAADFMSLDTTGISKPRKSNGALPDINFMKLLAGSDLIDAGTNVGIAFSGKAPDLGAYESGSVSTAPAPVVLTYQNSSVKNATPSDIEAIYNADIAQAFVPATTDFEVKVNSVTRTINKVAISGKNVLITMSSPVVHGDVVTLSYRKPDVNPLQCTAGTIAESISEKSVSNLVETVTPADTASNKPDPAPSDTTQTQKPPLAGQIDITPSTAKDFISIMNFDPGQSGAVLKLIDFSGKTCFEISLPDPSLMKKIPLTLAAGFYKARIVTGSTIIHNQKLIVVK
ncbi:MAG TPA: SwmB domain-containing protein [Bacteroidales bacterium]|nr:SwmB domain-containing protein [Bacteroidales bacterium]